MLNEKGFRFTCRKQYLNVRSIRDLIDKTGNDEKNSDDAHLDPFVSSLLNYHPIKYSMFAFPR